MKIGIYCRGFMGWGGGLDFLRLIVQSLLIATDYRSELHIILPDRGPRYTYHRAKAEIPRFIKRTLLGQQVSALAHDTAEAYFRGALGDFGDKVAYHHIGLSRRSLLSLCRSQGIDALVPCCLPLGRHFPIPWVGYTADFQHCHLPQYFTEKICVSRDRDNIKLFDEAAVVIVNAKAVVDDVRRFVPSAKSEVYALPFSASPEPSWLESRPELLTPYCLHTPYFLISNQFWVHKRHDVAFAAFAKVLKWRDQLTLVCTGDKYDWRKPDHFETLLAQLDSLGIRDKVKILGLIPKRHQIEMMKGALAVIQTTAFEGGPGGGSVFDAVSVGTPAIVSDIPVNMEIASSVWRHVPYGDDGALADAMIEVIATSPARPDAKTLLEQGRMRRQACGEAILAAIARSMALSAQARKR